MRRGAAVSVKRRTRLRQVTRVAVAARAEAEPSRFPTMGGGGVRADPPLRDGFYEKGAEKVFCSVRLNVLQPVNEL